MLLYCVIIAFYVSFSAFVRCFYFIFSVLCVCIKLLESHVCTAQIGRSILTNGSYSSLRVKITKNRTCQVAEVVIHLVIFFLFT